jgi:hypothetical protein
MTRSSSPIRAYRPLARRELNDFADSTGDSDSRTHLPQFRCINQIALFPCFELDSREAAA